MKLKLHHLSLQRILSEYIVVTRTMKSLQSHSIWFLAVRILVKTSHAFRWFVSCTLLTLFSSLLATNRIIWRWSQLKCYRFLLAVSDDQGNTWHVPDVETILHLVDLAIFVIFVEIVSHFLLHKIWRNFEFQLHCVRPEAKIIEIGCV